jgi:hypothetical protein
MTDFNPPTTMVQLEAPSPSDAVSLGYRQSSES